MEISNARILVVDDIEDNRHLLTRRLAREGFENVVVAADGEEALALIETHPFDLVLLDVMMPRCDGYEVLERLKAAGRLHLLPVIVISALNEMDSVIRCIQLGAVDYLSKPFNPTLLRARVHASLEKKSLRDAVSRHLQRLEKELEAARKLQMSMVPTFFPEPSAERPLEIFAVMEPAREVGGDFYDFFYDEDGVLFFAIADVSGKGVPAAMFMARAKNLLRVVTGMMQRRGAPVSAARVVGQVNRELCADNDTLMFVTLIFGWLDPKTGAGELCNAGHDPAIRVNGDAVAAISGPQGMALGINPEWPYEPIPFALKPRETLFFYTDGVSEAANGANELFTRLRLEELLRESRAQPLSEVADTMMRAVRNFAAGAEQSDDITSLSIRYLAGF